MSVAYERMSGRGQTATQINTSGGGKKLTMGNFCQVLEFAKEGNEDKPFRLRQITPFLNTCMYLVHTGKFRDKKRERPVRAPVISPSKLLDDDGFDKEIADPYYQAHKDGILDIQFRFEKWAAFIYRESQIAMPADLPPWTPDEEATFIKDPGSPSWTPVYAVRFTNKMVERMQALYKKNKHQTENGWEMCELSDPVYGHDIDVVYTGRTPNYYEVDLAVEDPSFQIEGQVIPVKGEIYEDEMEYLMPDIEEAILKMQAAENEAAMIDNIERLADMYDKNMREQGLSPDKGRNGYNDDTGSQDGGEQEVSGVQPTTRRTVATRGGGPASNAAPTRNRRSFGRDQTETQVEEGQPEEQTQQDEVPFDGGEQVEEQTARAVTRTARPTPSRTARTARPPRTARGATQNTEPVEEPQQEEQAEEAPVANTRTTGRRATPTRPVSRTAGNGNGNGNGKPTSSFAGRFKSRRQ